MYPLVPMEKPTARDLPVPAKSSFCVHVLAAALYSQKSFVLGGHTFISVPVPKYPLFPMEKPTASDLAVPPKSAFCVHVLVIEFHPQKSFKEFPAQSLPVPIYPVSAIEKPTAPPLA